MKPPLTTKRDNSFYHSDEGHTFYRSAIGERARILDLGANHGRFTQEMADRFDADVRMVEANPALHSELAAQGRFPVFHCAVTDEDGSIRFNVAQYDGGSSILDLPTESEYNCVLRESITVPSRTLESLLREIGWDRIDLIKIDIEGAEVRVLNSLTPDILSRICQITIEFHSHSAFQFGMEQEVESCLKRMREQGFLIIDFTFPARIDVLLINTRLIKVPWSSRLWWHLMYNPPRMLDKLARTIVPSGVRSALGSWRKRVTS